MTPEEFERLKASEKEHLKKLKELKGAVRILERQRKIQSALNEMTEASSDVLQTQADMVERLAMETAEQEARLEVALDSVADQPAGVSDEALEEELRQARARALVERLRDSETKVDEGGNLSDFSSAERSAEQGLRGEAANPTLGRKAEADAAKSQEAGSSKPQRSGSAKPATNIDIDPRPEKTIGRM